MDESKRMILGFVLIFLIMVIFQFYVVSNQKKALQKDKETATEVSEKEAKPPHGISKKPSIEETSLSELFTEKETSQKEESREEVVIQTSLLEAYLNSKGGMIDSVYLKDYDVTFYPLNKKEGLLTTSIISGKQKIPTDLFSFNVKIEGNSKQKRVIFSYIRDSIEIKKTYFFQDTSYVIGLECSPKAEYFYKISTFETGENLSQGDRYSGVVYSAGGKPNTINKKNLFKGKDTDVSGVIDWVGYKTKYFLISLVPDDYLEEFSVNKSPDNPTVFVRGESYARLYFGPLEYTTLASIKKGLENAIYFGWGFVRPISKLIYYFSKFLHKIFHNYGVVIIVFAVVMILILSPITISSFRSMSKMQNLQPKMQEIQKRFKDNPQQMNKEVMKLYRESGVNPFSSCLPLFIQMPIFFALYSVLNNSIELKGAPFILWIKDLSLKDPYYILPILMGISMFVQQRFTTTSQQAEQQKIFSYMMPIILTFFFLTFPSGLTLYWLSYNILMIFIQAYIKKKT